jgi:predicted AlkP superfamily pyrophosphatase or phosphodiesterase
MLRIWFPILLLASAEGAAKPPRLTLFIAVDALSSDSLQRIRPRLSGGLARLLSEGAYFPNARYEYAETVTSPGHTTLITGANPWRHGVVANQILDRATGDPLSAFTYPSYPWVGAPTLPGGASSPQDILAETLSDHLRLSTQNRGQTIAISAKARAAIPMAGRLGQAWWFSNAAGGFVSSAFYVQELPGWVKGFNKRNLPASYFHKIWAPLKPAGEYVGKNLNQFAIDQLGLGRVFPHPLTDGRSEPGPAANEALQFTPYMDQILVQFAIAAIEANRLGKHDAPDLLAVGFSTNDHVYHTYGPYSWEMQDELLQLDRSVDALLAAAEKAAGGRSNLMVTLSADHGGAPIPEELATQGIPAVRVSPAALENQLRNELSRRFGADILVGIRGTNVYLSPKAIAGGKLDAAVASRATAEWLSGRPEVALAVAHQDLNRGDGGYLTALRKGFYPERSGDVLFIPKPFHVMIEGSGGTTHGTPYWYDCQVPIVFHGPGVRRGIYPQVISTADLAPTLATFLEVGLPASSEGTPRSEIFAN